MKKLYFLLTLTLIANLGNSQWGLYGTGGFTSSSSSRQQITLRGGEPWVILKDSTGKTRVYKYDTGNWNTVSSTSLIETPTKGHQIITVGDTSYVAYGYTNGLTSLIVKKQSGNSAWSYLSSSLGADVHSINMVERNGYPLITYSEKTNNNIAVVKQYNGSSWDTFSAVGLPDSTKYQRLAVSTITNDVYLGYIKDTGNLKTLEVKKYNTTTSTWELIGSIDGIFNGGNLSQISLGINPVDDQIFVAYQTTPINATLPLYCKKFNGTTWGDVAQTPITTHASSPKIKFHPITKEVYLGAKLESGTKKNIIYRLSHGGNWASIDQGNMVGIDAGWTNFDIDKQTGQIFIAYEAKVNSSKTNVLKYTCNSVLPPTLTDNGTFLDAGTGFNSYKWCLNNNAVTTTHSSIYTPNLPGDYYCVAMNTNGCWNFSDTVSWGTTSIDKINKPDLVIYPNPSYEGIFNIKGNVNKSISLFNAYGQEVSVSLINNKVDISNHPKGLYILVLSDKKSSTIIKIVYQ
jgi:hypothetical protein